MDITDVTTERLSELKLKEEHGAEITMVDQDAPAGKAGLHEHDVILSVNGTEVESAAQLRRMIKETPPGRVVTLGISRDGQPMSIKVQLADRKKSISWTPDNHEYKFEMPEIKIPDIDIPVSVVIAHSSLRSGLMVENITPQLGDFFGVKGGKGVLVRSVEKGSRGEKAGFRAGDVVVKVNSQLVHDSSDFTHALRESLGGPATVTVVRDKKEQTLTITLPSKKDSGMLFENAFDAEALTAQLHNVENMPLISTEEIKKSLEAAARAQEKAQAEADKARQDQDDCREQLEDEQQDIQEQFQEKQEEFQEQIRDRQEEFRDHDKAMQEREKKLQHEMSGEWTEI